MKVAEIGCALLLTVTVVAARADGIADPVAHGKQLVEQKKCSICHQVDGKGGHFGKSLNGVAEGKTDQFLMEVFTDPKKALGPDTRMPSYKDKLTEDEIKAVIAYLKSLKK